ncbi:hypothetical protein Tco_0340553 [Tanacetum coccineum]
MMLLARAITQRCSTPTNIRLRSSNIRNQAVVQDGRVDIQSKNVGYAGNGNRNAGRQNRNQVTNARNGLVQSIEEYDQNAQRNPRTESTPGKTNMLLALKDEDGAHLDDEENDFMLDNAYGDNTLEELNAAIIMMAHIQPTNDKYDAKPTYDAEFISEVNASQVDMINGLLSKSDHEQRHHEKLETIIHTSTTQEYKDYAKEFVGEKMKEMSDTLNNLILELIVAKTNDLIKEAVPRLVNVVITRDRKIAPTNVLALIS